MCVSLQNEVQYEVTVPTAADRLLQRAVARILEAVFEADFLECSHGFRPGRNPHHALQALRVQIVTKKVMQVFEADIRSYFTRINRQWLRKMVAHRIADPVILSLIGKWLNAGAMQDGVVIYTEEGTPQGGPISPVLSNVYLHFLLARGPIGRCRESLWEFTCGTKSWLIRNLPSLDAAGRVSFATCSSSIRHDIHATASSAPVQI